MKSILKILFFTFSMLVAQTLQAIVVDIEGAVTSGLNDTSNTAQSLGSFVGTPLNVFGWIDELNVDDIDIFKIELTSDDTYYFDIDFANDVLTPNSDDDDGLDAVLHIFDAASGILLDSDDDVGFQPDPGSGPNGDFDPFIEIGLTAGHYFLAVSSSANTASDVNTWDHDGDSYGQYCLQIRTGYGFGAPANNCSVEVPEPTSLIILGLGLCGVGFIRCKKLQ